MGQKGCGLDHVTYFYILVSLIISETCKVRDFKFGAQIDPQACKPKNQKLCQEGRHLHHVTYFYNFGTPRISLERVKLDTSNLVCWLTARPANQKNAKVGQEGRSLCNVTYFYNFGTPCISGMGEARNIKLCLHIVRQTCKPKKCKSRSQGAWPRSRGLLL